MRFNKIKNILINKNTCININIERKYTKYILNVHKVFLYPRYIFINIHLYTFSTLNLITSAVNGTELKHHKNVNSFEKFPTL